MALRVEGIEVTIRGATVLRDVSLVVPAAGIVALVGRNGAGKTTTLRSIMGLVRVERGRVLLGDRDLLREKPHSRAGLGIGYMPEDRRLIPQLTVHDNLMVPIWANRPPDGESRLEGVYRRMPLVHGFRHQAATLLSGGQQKLVALARALTVGRRLLLLDEPFEGLAPALADSIAEAIRDVRDEQGLSVLFVESERRLVERLADKTFTIERGEIVKASG
ncbi:MAG: ABC transporter ATP-binding protein [Acidimicrobiia bacterium]